MSEQKPGVCRIVQYTLSEQDAEQINRRRDAARAHLTEHQQRNDGSAIHFGNHVSAGEVYPLVITRVWGETPTSAVNGQVLLDGNDTLWATSVTCGEGERHFQWPERT